MGWWVADTWNQSPVLLVSWVVWVIGSIVLHELAHGWAALSRGDTTPRDTGHMTWNPLVHMGQTSLIVFAIVGIAWGMMPVNPHRMRGRHAEAIVAAAGPVMNLGLAVLAIVANAVWVGAAGGYWFGFSASDTLFTNMQTFLRVGAMLNIVLLLFNLLPAPPLDGWRIAAHYWPRYRRLFESEQGVWLGLGLFVLVFWFAGDHLFAAASAAVGESTRFLLGLIVPGAV